MSMVWEHKWDSGEQMVMLSLADHADHEGGNIWPSHELTAYKTGYSKRHVRRIVTRLRVNGVLKVQKESSIHRPTTYYIDWSAATPKGKYVPEDRPDKAVAKDEDSDKMSAPTTTEDVTEIWDEKPDEEEREPPDKMSAEPSTGDKMSSNPSRTDKMSAQPPKEVTQMSSKPSETESTTGRTSTPPLPKVIPPTRPDDYVGWLTYELEQQGFILDDIQKAKYGRWFKIVREKGADHATLIRTKSRIVSEWPRYPLTVSQALDDIRGVRKTGTAAQKATQSQRDRSKEEYDNA